MKPFTSIFRRLRRPATTRKRPGRSLAMTFAALESRALLTIVGPVAVPTAMVAAVALSAQPPLPETTFSISPSSSNDLAFGNPGAGERNRTDNGVTPPATTDAGSPNGPPYDRVKNHVALSEADVTINGVTTPEFALANAGNSEVRIRIGDQVQILDATDGINHPQSVTLTYLNNGGNATAANPYPELVVANSGGNNVLVFPGLADGTFGPALKGNQGFTVGQNPVCVTVADVNNDGVPDLIVANQGSDTVSILQGQVGTGVAWNSNTVQTIAIGNLDTRTAPVMALYKDFNKDGLGDLFVLNSGSDNSYIYQGLGSGVFNTTDPSIIAVGKNPIQMLLGQFDRRSQLDMVTVNAGSDDLTLVENVLTPNPTTQTVSSGGIMPDAALAFPGPNGLMDLVVANSGDGHLALLQAGNTGLQLAAVITSSNLPNPTSLLASSWNASGIEFLAASAGQDAADLLRFDLGVGSTFLPMPISGSPSTSGAEEELVAGLMSFDDSSLELIAVFWTGSPDQAAVLGESNLREPGSITALYSPTEGQGDDALSPTAAVAGGEHLPEADPIEPDKSAPARVSNYVSGIDRKRQSTGDPIGPLAARDLLILDPLPALDQYVRLDRTSLDKALNPDLESAEGTIDEAIRMPLFQGQLRPTDDPSSGETPGSLESTRPLDGVDTSAVESPTGSVPLISSAVLISTRLICNVSTPQPPKFRKGQGFHVRPGKPLVAPPE